MSGVEGVGKTPKITSVGGEGSLDQGVASAGEEGAPNPMNNLKNAMAEAGQEMSEEKVMENIMQMQIRQTEGIIQRSRQRMRQEQQRAGLR